MHSYPGVRLNFSHFPYAWAIGTGKFGDDGVEDVQHVGQTRHRMHLRDGWTSSAAWASAVSRYSSSRVAAPRRPPPWRRVTLGFAEVLVTREMPGGILERIGLLRPAPG